MDLHPNRYFEMFIAEQNLVGAGIGLAKRGKIPFVSTFAAFLSRAYDQIRMSAISQANIKYAGSHCGVSIGEDGPSQMGLEDLAMFRAIPGAVVLYPSDAVAAERLVAEAAEYEGIVYLRTSRPTTPILYNAHESFPIGGCKVIRESSEDKVTLVAAGVALHEALKAYERLAAEGIAVRIIDLYSVKPVDKEALQRRHLRRTTPSSLLKTIILKADWVMLSLKLWRLKGSVYTNLPLQAYRGPGNRRSFWNISALARTLLFRK